MKEITTTVYEFDELSDAAKIKAREWWKEGSLIDEWWAGTYEDAAAIGLKITGFDLDRNRHATGEFTLDASQVAAAIIENHGKDCETFKTAQNFIKEYPATLQSEDDFASFDCESNFLKNILNDYSIILKDNYEYLLSDESVDENIKANDYLFTKDGRRWTE